jgi:hypothetical protein
MAESKCNPSRRRIAGRFTLTAFEDGGFEIETEGLPAEPGVVSAMLAVARALPEELPANVVRFPSRDER